MSATATEGQAAPGKSPSYVALLAGAAFFVWLCSFWIDLLLRNTLGHWGALVPAAITFLGLVGAHNCRGRSIRDNALQGSVLIALIGVVSTVTILRNPDPTSLAYRAEQEAKSQEVANEVARKREAAVAREAQEKLHREIERRERLEALVRQLPTANRKDVYAMQSLYGALSELQPENEEYRREGEKFNQIVLADQERIREGYLQRTSPASYLKMDLVRWTRGGFDTVFIGTFKVSNPLAFPIKDVGVVCDIAAASGTAIGSVRGRIMQRVGPKSSKVFSDVNLGFLPSQAQGAVCSVTSAEAM